MLHFNVACYECQLGGMDAAKARLGRCFDLDKSWRAKALEDEDLKQLWDSL